MDMLGVEAACSAAVYTFSPTNPMIDRPALVFQLAVSCGRQAV